jgi:hypothetical protein
MNILMKWVPLPQTTCKMLHTLGTSALAHYFRVCFSDSKISIAMLTGSLHYLVNLLGYVMKETKNHTKFWLKNLVDRDYFGSSDTTEIILGK